MTDPAHETIGAVLTQGDESTLVFYTKQPISDAPLGYIDVNTFKDLPHLTYELETLISALLAIPEVSNFRLLEHSLMIPLGAEFDLTTTYASMLRQHVEDLLTQRFGVASSIAQFEALSTIEEGHQWLLSNAQEATRD